MTDIDPPRLTDPGSEAPESLREMLDSARGDVATPAEVEALAASLGPALGVAGATVGTSTGVSLAAKVGITMVIAAGLGGGWWLTRNASEPTETPAAVGQKTAPDSTAPAPEPAAAAAAPEEEPEEEKAPAQDSPPVDEPDPAPSESATSTPKRAAPSEASLLGAAQAALASNPKRALELTRRHRTLYPNGMLGQEREVIAIEALRRLGSKEKAKERAEKFNEEFPGSPHERKVGDGKNQR